MPVASQVYRNRLNNANFDSAGVENLPHFSVYTPANPIIL